MFNVPNDYFISPPSSSNGMVFNHNTRYHPYRRMATSYYPSNEYSTYSIDNNNHSIQNFDYKSAWNENETVIQKQPGNMDFFYLFKSTENLN